MKFKCSKDELIKGLNSVSKTVATKTTLPIQEGILIETIGDNIKLTTNDLEIGTEYTLKAEIESMGTTVIDMKTFNEIIRKIESNEITFEVNNGIFVIKSTSGVFKLQTMNADEYKRLPVFNVEKQIEISQKLFKEMVKKTVFAASVDINRPVYTGVLITVNGNVIDVVAIDGYRMAIKKELLDSYTSDFKAIIPAKVLTEVIKSIDDEDNKKVKIGVNRNQALFEMGECTVVSRIIDGDFINYNNVLPAEADTKVTINRRGLLDAIERVAIFSRDVSEKDKKIPVKVSIKLDSLEVSCVSVTGDAKEIVNSVVEGKELEIGFNPKFLMDALRVIEDEEINIELGTSISPLVIKPLAGNTYIYMVLPIKLKEE
ncbi:MAG: DNA polymerase III subunit beta [Clostridia bacterium]|nr:DNA polymerase III subunit beta [Clostridia bacterium]